MGSVTAYSTARGKRYKVQYRRPDHSSTSMRGSLAKRKATLFLASVEVSVSRGAYVDPTPVAHYCRRLDGPADGCTHRSEGVDARPH